VSPRYPERIPLDDGYEDSLIHREPCGCGDVIVVGRYTSSEHIEQAVKRHNQRLRHRTWVRYEFFGREP